MTIQEKIEFLDEMWNDLDKNSTTSWVECDGEHIWSDLGYFQEVLEFYKHILIKRLNNNSTNKN